MLAIVNALGTLTVGLCAFLLLRGYARVKQRLLLWSGLCFVGLTVSNVFLVVDRLVLPDVDLTSFRLGAALLGLLLMLGGLIWEHE